jgi:hypothetical protein
MSRIFADTKRRKLNQFGGCFPTGNLRSLRNLRLNSDPSVGLFYPDRIRAIRGKISGRIESRGTSELNREERECSGIRKCSRDGNGAVD